MMPRTPKLRWAGNAARLAFFAKAGSPISLNDVGCLLADALALAPDDSDPFLNATRFAERWRMGEVVEAADGLLQFLTGWLQDDQPNLTPDSVVMSAEYDWQSRADCGLG